MIALDLFAGTGWGVACQALGIEEYGVEIMPEAVATRAANGMTTIYRDVWEGLGEVRPRLLTDAERAERERVLGKPIEEWDAIDLLIASPPCQTFSMAGGGAGRKALDDVLGLIDAKAYRSVEGLRAFGETHDPRTALVLTPLAHVYRDLPRYVVFEQVPPVLPVWERCAEEMRAWGYSVWTGNLQAEMYGVPQTRKRAILIAKRDPDLDGEAAPPVPTHSRYYSRDPKRLDEGVLPWVSMAEALGWGRSARPSVTVTGGGTETGGAEPLAKLAREVAAADWVIRLDPTLPATTVQGDPRLTAREHHYHGEQNSTSTRITVEEAAALQSYPAGFTFAGTKTKQFLQIGNAVPPLLAEAILRAVIS